MARKRKIPARKHHGIRDPLKQIEEREKKIKNVINNPPEKGDEQKVSFKFAAFKKLADDTKAGKKIKRIRRGREDLPRCETTTTVGTQNDLLNNKRLGTIRQMVGEDDEDYLKRVNRVTTESLREAEYETKYGVNVVRNSKTGEISVKKRPKNEIDEMLKQKRNQKKGTSKSIQPTIDSETAKALIKQAIKEGKEEDKTRLPEYKVDTFRFGEVVHAPPILSILPRKATKNETVPRPGKKNNLLLQSMLNKTTDASKPKILGKKSQILVSQITRTHLTRKRKDLPLSTRTMLEQEQSKIIEHYRNLKKYKEK